MNVPKNPFATHPNEDPDHLAARAAKESFTAAAADIQSDDSRSETWKAERLAHLHEQHVKEVAEAHQRIIERRQARLDYLTALVPSGPGIPEDASEADRSVLIAAFRHALGEVRQAGAAEQRARLLAEAERYGDTAMVRAVLTYASEVGELDIVEGWVDRTHGAPGYAAEVRQLRSGRGAWDLKDFRPLPKPASRGRVVRPGVIEYRR